MSPLLLVHSVLCRLASPGLFRRHTLTLSTFGGRARDSFGSQYNARSVRDLGIDGSRTSDAETNSPLSSDALLGLLAHSTLAIGLIALSFMTWVRVDLLGFLFGDVLAINQLDLLTIGLGGTVVLLVLKVIWRPLFAATVSPEIARAEGLRPERAEVIFMILMASVIAISMKIVGVLLITALLIIPAASARCFSKSPEQMALYSVLAGILSVIVGLQSSLTWDTPAGPSIVAALLLLFIVSTLSMPKIRSIKRKYSNNAGDGAIS